LVAELKSNKGEMKKKAVLFSEKADGIKKYPLPQP
jgi:hypothetical protein